MRKVRLPLIAPMMIVIVAACSSRDPVANGANSVGLPGPVNDTGPSALGEPPDNGASPANGAVSTAAVTIPAVLHGRWGLTPADCTTTRGDAKGLLVISAGELRFYESRAVPGNDAETDGDSINGRFNFTGEGQNWSKFEALKLSGAKLTRTETNPAASFTYAKC